MYSLKRKFIVLYNVDLFANSRNPHFPDTITDKITLYLKARMYCPSETDQQIVRP